MSDFITWSYYYFYKINIQSDGSIHFYTTHSVKLYQYALKHLEGHLFGHFAMILDKENPNRKFQLPSFYRILEMNTVNVEQNFYKEI